MQQVFKQAGSGQDAVIGRRAGLPGTWQYASINYLATLHRLINCLWTLSFSTPFRPRAPVPT